MKVALAPIGSRGDVQPLLALGQALRAAGHAVVVCAPPDFAAWVRGLGFEFHAVGRDMQAWLTTQAEQGQSEWAVFRALGDFLVEEAAVQVAGLDAALAGDVDLLVGGGLQLAGSSIAEARGVPYSYAFYFPWLIPSAEHPPVMCPWPRTPRWFNRLAWAANDAHLGRLLRPALSEGRARLGLGPLPHIGYVLPEQALLACDAALAPAPRDTAAQVGGMGGRLRGVEQTGAWMLDDRAPLPPELEAFLAAGPPPVYVGFGSMPDPDPRATTARIVEAVGAAGARAVLASGWAGLVHDALPPTICAVKSAPHAALFPRVAAIVHHGGAGTIAAAARAGVPQLVVPHLLDQVFWGARVARLGVGPAPLPKRRLTAKRLAAGLEACLGDASMRARAAALRKALEAAGDGLDRAVALLEAEFAPAR